MIHYVLDELGIGPHPGFFEEASSVRAHRLHAEGELRCYFAHRLARADEDEDLKLTFGQSFVG